MNIKLIYAIVFAIFLVTVSSCGNDLSRDKAATLIIEHRQFPKVESTDISKIYVVKFWIEGHTPGICRQFPLFAEVSAKLKDLETKKLIQISERSVWQNSCNHIFADITLTDEGRKYLISETDKDFVVKTAEITVDEVTGIRTNKDQNSAIADYSLKRINVTPFGADSQGVPKGGQVQLMLYDDGWRVE